MEYICTKMLNFTLILNLQLFKPPLCKCFETLLPAAVATRLVPRLLPYRKTGREPGSTTVVLCMVLIIELLPTQSVPLSMAVLSGTRAVIGVLDQWMSLRL